MKPLQHCQQTQLALQLLKEYYLLMFKERAQTHLWTSKMTVLHLIQMTCHANRLRTGISNPSYPHYFKQFGRLLNFHLLHSMFIVLAGAKVTVNVSAILMDASNLPGF